MKRDRIRGFCTRCRHEQIFERAETHHGVHFFLTVVTFGLWLVSWIASSIGHRIRPWRCLQCNWPNPVFDLPNEPRSKDSTRTPSPDGSSDSSLRAP